MRVDPEQPGTPEPEHHHPGGSARDPDEAVEAAIRTIRNARYSAGITSWQQSSRKNARREPFPGEMHSDLIRHLQQRRIDRLYTHQAAAWMAVKNGLHPVIVTPTASGKTLCYNLPIIDRLLREPSARALYLFPAKALGQDQFHELMRFEDSVRSMIRPGIYDGDTPSDSRRRIRESARIVLTNPDMIHSGILPHHARWAAFLKNLEFIVIDELHQYRGVFGSHVCNVIRRLRRICDFHGSRPQFIMSSATIANPQEFAGRLIGEPVQVIDQSGAPAGERTVLFYNPPVVDSEGMIRRSYLEETLRFVRVLLAEDVQTLVFARSRHNVELLLMELKRSMRSAVHPGAIRGYRGGYLPGERREIEAGLRDGTIRCVIATSALELGVDIGDMGAVVMAGYPGTIASTWQRAGRAGRREKKSLAVMVASAAPLDQYIVRNPEYFFDRPAEHALINPDNLLILLAHIRCAAFELPFGDSERYAGLDETMEFLEYLESAGELQHSGDRWFFTGGTYPAEAVSLRSISSQSIVIVSESEDRAEVIGEIDGCAAGRLIHPEAVYLHGGSQYLVRTLDFEAGRARVQAMDIGYFTAPLETVTVDVIDEPPESTQSQCLHFGELKVTSRVIGYKKLRFSSMELLGTGTVQLPDQELITFGAWFAIPPEMEPDASPPANSSVRAAGLTAALTAIHSIASVLLMCDPRDLGGCVAAASGAWTVQMDHLGMMQISGQIGPTDSAINLFIFDRYPGGIGLCEQLVRIAPSVVSNALVSVKTCECRHGCPACIGPVMGVADTVKSDAIDALELIAGLLDPGLFARTD